MTLAVGLANDIPLFGFGTYPLRGEDARRAVTMALDLGIRHIDTAQMYGNERDVGRALRDSGLRRGEIFVVTKVDPGNLGADRFDTSVARSMDDLGGPADLLLIHWPPHDAELEAVVDRLQVVRERGMTRCIGVSNFSPRLLRRAQLRAAGALVNNQVEFHPLLDQSALLAAARELGIVLSAYSPLARGKALAANAVRDIARRRAVPESAVVLRWTMQQGVAVIPMTTKIANARDNLKALTFELSDAEMAAVSRLGSRSGRIIDPGWMAGRWD
ncbi:MAG: aldo/keto reductase [Hyphomicrobiales bacterium]